MNNSLDGQIMIIIHYTGWDLSVKRDLLVVIFSRRVDLNGVTDAAEATNGHSENECHSIANIDRASIQVLEERE